MMERGRPSPGYGHPRDSECAEYEYGENAEQPVRQIIDPDPVAHEASPEKRAHLLPGAQRLGRKWAKWAEVERLSLCPKPPALTLAYADFFFLGSSFSTSACWRRTVSRTVSVRSEPSLPTAISSTTRAVLLTTGRSAVSVTVYSLSLQSISAM